MRHDLDQFHAILEAARDGSLLAPSPMHGEQHWRAVACSGLSIAEHEPGVDAEVVLLFAVLHDCRRENDYLDPLHGFRAARRALELHHAGVLELDHEAFAQLYTACLLHTNAQWSADLTVGACFDADRVNLPRCGIDVSERFLSTGVAKRAEFLDECALHHDQQHDWVQLWERCAQLQAAGRGRELA